MTITYYSSASAEGKAIARFQYRNAELVTATATATATSTLSQADADSIAKKTAQQVADSQAKHDADVIVQSVNTATQGESTFGLESSLMGNSIRPTSKNSFELVGDFNIPGNRYLKIEPGQTFIINPGITFSTSKGAIRIDKGATVICNGTIYFGEIPSSNTEIMPTDTPINEVYLPSIIKSNLVLGDLCYNTNGNVIIEDGATLVIMENGFLYNSNIITLGNQTDDGTTNGIISNAGTIFNNSLININYGYIGNGGFISNNQFNTNAIIYNYDTIYNDYGTINNYGNIYDYGLTSNDGGTIINYNNGIWYLQLQNKLLNSYGTYNNNTQIYTLTSNLTLPSFYTLLINNSQTFTINNNVTLTNVHSITNNGTITNNGVITNNGSITNNETITNNGVITNNRSITNNETITNNNIVYDYGTTTNYQTITNSTNSYWYIYLQNSSLKSYGTYNVTTNTFTLASNLNLSSSFFNCLYINDNEIFLINSGIKLTNSVLIINNGIITNNGNITNSSIVYDYGTTTNFQTITNSTNSYWYLVLQNSSLKRYGTYNVTTNTFTLASNLSLSIFPAFYTFYINNIETFLINTSIELTNSILIINNGNFLNNGIITNNENITNNLIIINDGTITNNYILINNSTITNNGTITNNENITNNSTITNDGTIINSANVYDNSTTTNNKTITNSDKGYWYAGLQNKLLSSYLNYTSSSNTYTLKSNLTLSSSLFPSFYNGVFINGNQILSNGIYKLTISILLTNLGIIKNLVSNGIIVISAGTSLYNYGSIYNGNDNPTNQFNLSGSSLLGGGGIIYSNYVPETGALILTNAGNKIYSNNLYGVFYNGGVLNLYLNSTWYYKINPP